MTYNLRTVGALAKQVYVAERLAPPTSTESILSAYKSIWAFASNPAQWTRLVQNGDWKKVGIYSVEALGIFTIGEMVSLTFEGYRVLVVSLLTHLSPWRRSADDQSSDTASTPSTTDTDTTRVRVHKRFSPFPPSNHPRHGVAGTTTTCVKQKDLSRKPLTHTHTHAQILSSSRCMRSYKPILPKPLSASHVSYSLTRSFFSFTESQILNDVPSQLTFLGLTS